MLPRYLPSALVIAALGCSPDPSQAPAIAQRDSAGIVIVENPADMDLNDDGWGVDEEPFLSIGSFDGDDASILYEVVGGHRMADGRVAIVNNGTKDIRIFDSFGAPVGSIGGEGDGPEEFRSTRMAGSFGQDTLVVTDVSRRRLTLIHPDQGILRSAPVEEGASRFPVPSGMFADGHLVFGREGTRVVWTEDFEEGPARIPIEFKTCDLQGRFSGSLGQKPGSEVFLRFMAYDGEPRVRREVWPLAKTPQTAVSSDRFYFGSQDRFEIEAVDPEGTVRRLIRVGGNPMPVTFEAWSIYVEEEIRRMATDEDHERRLRAVYEEAEKDLPATFPAHGSLRADLLDHLWVEEYRLPGDAALIWSVFHPDGRRLARVALPRAMEILEIGDDYVMGLVRDALDVEYVQMYRLHRGGTEG